MDLSHITFLEDPTESQAGTAAHRGGEPFRVWIRKPGASAQAPVRHPFNRT